jgi:hypothetical protein
MTIRGEALRHDAAALYHFVDSICARCDERRASPAYLGPSRKFFRYIRELGQATKVYTNDFVNSVPKDPRLYKVYREKLHLLASSWTALHRYVKAALDADTPSIPSPLVDSFLRRFTSIPRFKDAAFTVFHLHELNYLQVRAGFVRALAKKLRSIIPGAPEFPSNLGMIGIPYSQSSAVYLNCLIPHEMGHFVFQELDKFGELAPEIEKSLHDVLGAGDAAVGKKKFSLLKPEHQAWCINRVASWTEEIFCDLFAVTMVGPAYSMAYIELFGLTTVLDPATSSNYALTPEFCEFSASHPADLFRLKQHVALLGELGYEKKRKRLTWWDEVKGFQTHYVDVLKAAANIGDIEYISSADQRTHQYYDETRKAFFGLASIVRASVINTVGGIDLGLHGFQLFRQSIEEYLSHGVVPSTVLVKGHLLFPAPIAVLNASWKFYLESLDILISRIEGQDPAKVSDRQRWIERLELWTIKAIEDHKLLTGQKKE